MTNDKAIDPINQTTPQAVRQSKELIRSAQYGSLAFLNPATNAPGISRVSVSTDMEGAPVILISRLSAHTKALEERPVCSLLLGEPGKGDPLAHPRISLDCSVHFLDREASETRHIAGRFIRKNPKAALYADFSDFSYVRLQPICASLNGGFGKAFRLTGADLLSPPLLDAGNGANEEQCLAKIQYVLADMLPDNTRNLVGLTKGKPIAISLDSEGLDFANSGRFHRIWFHPPISTTSEVYNQMLNLR